MGKERGLTSRGRKWSAGGERGGEGTKKWTWTTLVTHTQLRCYLSPFLKGFDKHYAK